MKTLRKNIDLDTGTIAILQIEATLSGYGTLKPFLEKIIADYCSKAKKSRQDFYLRLLDKRDVGVRKKRKASKV